jgi:hypothetical protein
MPGKERRSLKGEKWRANPCTLHGQEGCHAPPMTPLFLSVHRTSSACFSAWRCWRLSRKRAGISCASAASIEWMASAMLLLSRATRLKLGPGLSSACVALPSRLRIPGGGAGPRLARPPGRNPCSVPPPGVTVPFSAAVAFPRPSKWTGEGQRGCCQQANLKKFRCKARRHTPTVKPRNVRSQQLAAMSS